MQTVHRRELELQSIIRFTEPSRQSSVPENQKLETSSKTGSRLNYGCNQNSHQEILQVSSPPRTGTAEPAKCTPKSKSERGGLKESKMDQALKYFSKRGTVDAKKWMIQERHPEQTFEFERSPVFENPPQIVRTCENAGDSHNRTAVPRKYRCILTSCSKEHTAVVNRCIFNHDSTILITVSGDCSCQLFRRSKDRFSGNDLWTKESSLGGHKIGIWGVAISSNDDFIFTSGGDGKIQFWLMGTRIPPQMDAVEIRKILGKRGENSTGTQAEIFSRLKVIMSLDEDIAKRDGFYQQYVNSERRWLCAQILECEQPVPGRVAITTGAADWGAVFDCALHPSNNMLATAWGDGAVRVFRGTKDGIVRCDSPAGFAYDQWAWVCLQTLCLHSESVFRCGFDLAGDVLASASKDSTVILCHATPDGFVQHRVLSGHMGPVLGLGLHPCGRVMASGSCDCNVVIWFLADIAGAGPTWLSIATLFGHEDYVRACSFREDGQLLATASRDRTVRLWKTVSHPADIGQLRQVRCLEVLRCQEEVCSVQFARGSRAGLLVAGTLGGSVYFWDTDACLKCSRPFEVEITRVRLYSQRGRTEVRETILFKDEGRMVHPRPLTAASEWRRMETPNHIVQSAKPSTQIEATAVSATGLASQTVVYAVEDPSRMAVSLGFRTMDPRNELDMQSACKRIRDYTAATLVARESMAQSRVDFSDADVSKVESIAKVLLQEMNLEHAVKLKRDAFLSILQNNKFLDSQSIAITLSNFLNAVHELLKNGKLTRQFPNLKRRKNGRRWYFGRFELESLLGINVVHSKHSKSISEETLVFNGQTNGEFPLETAGLENLRGAQLASELSLKTVSEAKRILGERIVKIISPELVWTKDEIRLAGLLGMVFCVSFSVQLVHCLKTHFAGKIAVNLLATFEDNSANTESFRAVCFLVFNRRRLYKKSLEILQDLNLVKRETMQSNISVAHKSSADSLQIWSGADGASASIQNRCSSPLYSSISPTTIGTVFEPSESCKILNFKAYLCMATTQTTKEARDRDRRQAAGVSFKFLISKWDVDEMKAGEIMYMSDERMVTEHCFEPFVLNCEVHPNIIVHRSEAVLLAFTSSSCEAYCKGAAWISGIGLPDKHQLRKGFKYPDPPEQLRRGTFVFAGMPDGDPRNVWIKLDEILACKVEFSCFKSC